MVSIASKMAFIPVWFLAVYVIVVVLAPLTCAAREKYGLWSFWALALAAVLDVILFFAAEERHAGPRNRDQPRNCVGKQLPVQVGLR